MMIYRTVKSYYILGGKKMNCSVEKIFIKTLKNYIILIVAVALICGFANGYHKKKQQVATYTSSAKIAVNSNGLESENLYDDLAKQARYDSILALSTKNLKLVSKDVDIPETDLYDMRDEEAKKTDGCLTSTTRDNVVFVEFTCKEKEKCTEVITSLAENLIQIEKKDNPKLRFEIIDLTQAKKNPLPSLKRDRVMGAALGLLVSWMGLGAFECKKYLDGMKQKK